MDDMAKILILVGSILVAAGLFFLVVGKFPGVGHFPGDILIKKSDFTFYFPITTSILISVLLSIILFFLNRK